MISREWRRRAIALAVAALLAFCGIQVGFAQQDPVRFGGAYSGLGERRQQLVGNWVARFSKTTGQKVEAGPFYDEILTVSTKTTFDAVTHALMTTTLTDASSTALGDALSLIEYVESVRGQVTGSSGDRQFRMYVRLVPTAVTTLQRSREFKRGVDNTIFHKGYPTNYRAQGGPPSIQISIAADGRRADVDVDYRSSMFPVSLFNGHLSASNSDVRAGDNAERHAGRWAGLQKWWSGFFGVSLARTPDAEPRGALALPPAPRAGNKNIDVMAHDFLTAWLIEGNITEAMAYISEWVYACMAQDTEDPLSVDRGMSPFELMGNLKAAHDALGKHDTLVGLSVGIRPTARALKVVRQPYHAQFVITSVPDDVAAAFDCETRLSPTGARRPERRYGNYFGVTFFLNDRKDSRVTLLWAKDRGFWKIVSWRTGDDDDTPAATAAPDVKLVRIKADPAFAKAAREFLDTWLIRKNYDAAFRVLSPASYACYDLTRGSSQPASTSREDAGRQIRAALERTGQAVGTASRLDAILAPAEPIHPAVRVMDHADSRTFTLTSVPNALGDVVECDARARGAVPPDPIALVYGEAFSMNVRFRTASGDAPVLRLLWRNEGGAWRIRAYDVEVP